MIGSVLVKTESPVEDKASFLFKWDALVRKDFWKFEADKGVLQMGLNGLYANALTKFRDPI